MYEPLIFEPQKWHHCEDHNWKTCNLGVNCYSYVLNNPNYYWAVPGFGFAHTTGKNYVDSFNNHFKNMKLDTFQKLLIEGAVKDGVIKVDKPEDREGYYLSVLFFSDEDRDFHWYRKDDDGFWSSKDGWKKATNKDKNNKLITDPRKDSEERYPVFGSYFLVPQEKIIFKESFPLIK